MSARGGTASRRATAALAVGLAAVVAARLLALPLTHWELDEWLFRYGVERFAPLEHHPHPPGYPLLIGLGKAFATFTGDPFKALVALATVSSVLTYLALADAFRSFSRDAWVGVVGALLFSLSPAMMVHSTTPMSDPPALFFLALGLAAGARMASAPVPAPAPTIPPSRRGELAARWRQRRELAAPALFGAALSASIGCRPQYAVALVPTLLAGCLAARSGRARLAAAAAFGLTCLAWLVPLVVASAGWERFLAYQRAQVETVATQDAVLARGARSWLDLGQRFVLDGWGAPAWAGAIVGLALIGLSVLMVARRGAAMLLLLMAAAHLAFTLVSSDPADGVRYALPVQMATAFLAAVAVVMGARVTPWPRTAALAFAALVGAISWRYTLPVLDARRNSPSPPMQAALWAQEHLPPRTVLITDPALRPHADATMGRYRRFGAHEGLARFWNRPKVPLYVFAAGSSAIEEAAVFSWPYSDAYARLTRNHFRVVSLAPIEPGRRYREIEGLYEWERATDRGEWRWLAPEARLGIPPGEGPIEVELELSGDPPYARTEVTFHSGEEELATASVERGGTAVACVPMPGGGGILTIRTSASFVPAESGAGRDRRRLGVKLLDLRRRPDLADSRGEVSSCGAQRRAA